MKIVIQLLLVGLMVGTLYGMLGVTLTLMFRSTGILSFAHAGFALIGAYMYAGFACPSTTGTECGEARFSSPWLAAAICVVTTTVVALVVERLVIRPLQFAAVIRKSIATAAVLGLSSGVMLQVYGPQPRGVPAEEQLFPIGDVVIAGVVLDYQRLGILLVSSVLMAAIALGLRRSWFGLAVRAAGQRPDVVRLFGVRPANISRFNWALGGALSGLVGVLVAPVSVVNIGTFSFLLVKAVAAALLGGLVSLPLTFVGGLLLGAVEAVTPNFLKLAGSGTVGIAVLVFASLIVNKKLLTEQRASGSAISATAVPGRFQLGLARGIAGQAALVSRVPRPVWAVLGLLVLVVPLRDAYWGAIGLNVVFWTLLALSLVIPLGDAGQPTFLQIGFAGVAAYTISTLRANDVPFALAVPVALLLVAVLGYAVGSATLRFRGAAFAIVSLTIAAVISDFVLNLDFVESSAGNPTLFGLDLLESNKALIVALVLLAAAYFLVFNFRRSALGVNLRTLKGGSLILSQFGADALKLERTVFTASAVIAGAAGIVYSLLVSSFTTFQFIPLLGVIVLLAGFVGGLGSLGGPLLAGVIFGYGPTLISNLSSNASANAFPQIASSLLALVLVVLAPGGLASLGLWSREVLAQSPPSSRPAVTFRGHPVLPEHFVNPPLWPPMSPNVSPRVLGGHNLLPRPRLRRPPAPDGASGLPRQRETHEKERL